MERMNAAVNDLREYANRTVETTNFRDGPYTTVRSIGEGASILRLDEEGTFSSAGARRHVEKGNGSLAETVGMKMLPTPTASDARRADSVTDRARNTPPLTVVTEYFPDLIGESMSQRSEGGKG